MRINHLADLILRGSFTVESVSQRLELVLLHKKFPKKLASRIVRHLGEGTRPSLRAVIIFLENDKILAKKIRKGKLNYSPYSEAMIVSEMSPDRSISMGWEVPSICSLGELAERFGVTMTELDWFAQRFGCYETGSRLSHYHVLSIPKKRSGTRVLEAPKWRLKQIQRKILSGILDQIPSHHSSHGFKKKHSIISYVRPHVGKEFVVKFDLKDYFLTVGQARVRSLFHVAGYPPSISQYLARLCTHSCRLDFEHPSSRKYRESHLPQGAPTSPAIANLLLYKVDIRLEALAKKMKMDYTRYADDMAFSGGKISPAQVAKFIELVKLIITEEGWLLNASKTRVMPQSQRQRLAGLVINSKTNVCRKEYDLLRAIIYRVQKNGIESENRDNHPFFMAHLEGRIGFVKMTNIGRGEKLERLLNRIE